MSVINTNITSMIGQQNLNKSQNALQTSMERLSSGLRINSAKDDAAGQAIANRMTAQISGLAQAQRNANDGISIAQTTEGGLNQINDNLQRIRELTVQAANGTNSQNDLQSIQDEVTQRLNEINRISEETDFNGTRVLSEAASSLTIQVGAEDGQTISVNIQTINSNSLGLADFDVRKAQPVASETLSEVGSLAVDDAANFDVTSAAAAGGTAQGLFDDGEGNYFVQITGSTDPADDGFYAATLNADGTVATTGTAPATTAVTPAGDISSLDANAALGANVYENGGNLFVEVTGSTVDSENGLYAATLDASTGEVTIDDASTGPATIAIQQDTAGDITDLTLGSFGAGATFEGVFQETATGNYFVEVANSATGSENGFYAATIDADGAVTVTNTSQTPDSTAAGDFTAATEINATAAAAAYTDTSNNVATPASEFTAVTEVPDSGNTPTFAADAVTAGIDTPELVQLTTADGREVYAIQDANGDRFAADVDEDTGLVTAQSVTYTDAAGVEQTSAVQLGGIDGVTGYVTVADAEGNDINYASEALNGTDLQTAENVAQVSLAQTTDPLAQLDDALKQVDSLRSELGAVQNRFESAIENLSTNETNLSAARSRIEDADYAVEVADMTRAQILQQAGTSVLAQANQIPQNVLSLLG